MIDRLIGDLRYAARTLLKQRGFSFVAVVTLALGIGATTTVFSLMNALFYGSLPFADPDRLGAVAERFGNSGGAGQIHLNPLNFSDWTADRSVFQGAALYGGVTMNLTPSDAEPVNIEGASISPELFDVLGVRPALGRGLLMEDAVAGRSHVVVLSDAVWRSQFAADSRVLGSVLRLDGAPYTIVGVMPPVFAFPDQAKFWVPFVLNPTWARGSNWVDGVVRLAPGVTAAQADAHLKAISERLATTYGTNVTAFVAPVRRLLLGGADPDDLQAGFLVMLGAVGVVLVIVCANLANLLLARSTTRRREIAIRRALGAGRARVVQQLLTESSLLALVGGAGGVLVALWAIDLLRLTIPGNYELPYWLSLGVDGRVLLFTVVVSVVTGLIFGTWPALRATESGVPEGLKTDARGTGTGRQGTRQRGLLIVAQVALSMVLLVAAGLLVRTLRQVGRVDPGFAAAHAFTARINLGGERYDSVRARGALLNDLARRLEATPGIAAVGAINFLPLSGSTNWEDIAVAGRSTPPGGPGGSLVSAIAAHYFAALEIPLVEGRPFTEAETEVGGRVAIVNQTFARHYWGGASAVGRQIRIGRDSTAPYFTVVGVARDIKYGGLVERPRDQLYTPYPRAAWRSLPLVIRATGDPLNAVAATRRELRRLDPSLALYDVTPLSDVVRRSMWQQRLSGATFTAFGLVALLITAIGLYGVTAYAVAQRTHEFGVRLALGAQPQDVLTLVLGRTLRLTVWGVAAGGLVALGIARILAGQLYGVGSADPLTFVSIALLLAAVALAAALIPARRATRVDPMTALRTE